MKKVIKKITAFAVLIMLIAVSTFSTEVEAASKGVKKVSITSVKTKKLTMNKGTTKTLNVKVTTTKKKISKAFTVKSSNKKVVKVVKSGNKIKLNALKNGKSTITVTSKADKKKKCTLKVTVVTPVKPKPVIAVSGISLDKTSISAYAGATVNLVATIAPATASNKSVVWSSSNNNLATVSNGVVTLKAAGTVTITASSAANSTKVAKCTIDIKAPNYIKSIECISEDMVKVELAKAQNITSDKFKVMIRSSVRASYICSGDIADISTNDNKIYTVVLKDEDLYGCYVKVGVVGLEGVQGEAAKEIRMMPKAGTYETETVLTSVYKETSTSSSYFSPSKVLGNYIISYGAVPAWMEATNNGNEVYIKRKLNVLGRNEFVLNAKDEYGHIVKHKYIYIIYDSEHMYGYAGDVYGVTKGDKGYEVGRTVKCYGVSGSYTYEIDGEAYGLTVSTSGYVSGKIYNPGDYKIRVKVTDSSNSDIYTYIDFTVHVKQGALITGVVKDAMGSAMDDAYIEVDNVDDSDKYATYTTCGYSNSDGTYNLYVTPGTYNIKVASNDSDYYHYYYNIVVTDKGVTYNVNLPLYKITPQIDTTKYTYASYWYDSKGMDVGYGTTIYLRKGSYVLKTRTTRRSDSEYVTLMMNINVTGEMTVTPTEIPYEERQ